jgi:hypothetical protein
MNGNTSPETGEDRLSVRWVVIGAISVGIGSLVGVSTGLSAAELFDPQLGITVGAGSGFMALLGTTVKLNKIVGK